MNEQMENLENQLKVLTEKFNVLENRTSTDVNSITQELNYIKFEMERIQKEFDALKESLPKDENDLKLSMSIEDVNRLVELIEKYFQTDSIAHFGNFEASNNDIDDVRFSIDYDNEITLDSVDIRLGHYFSNNYEFELEYLLRFAVKDFSAYSYEHKLMLMIDFELFKKLDEYFEEVVNNSFTSSSHNFNECDDFDVSLYDKSLEVGQVIISDYQLQSIWNDEFEYNSYEVSEIIANHFQVKSEEKED